MDVEFEDDYEHDQQPDNDCGNHPVVGGAGSQLGNNSVREDGTMITHSLTHSLTHSGDIVSDTVVLHEQQISGQLSQRHFHKSEAATVASSSGSGVEVESATTRSSDGLPNPDGSMSALGSWPRKQFRHPQAGGWHLVIRLISNTTNTRTLIGGVCPQSGLGNSLCALQLVPEVVIQP